MKRKRIRNKGKGALIVAIILTGVVILGGYIAYNEYNASRKRQALQNIYEGKLTDDDMKFLMGR